MSDIEMFLETYLNFLFKYVILQNFFYTDLLIRNCTHIMIYNDKFKQKVYLNEENLNIILENSKDIFNLNEPDSLNRLEKALSKGPFPLDELFQNKHQAYS